MKNVVFPWLLAVFLILGCGQLNEVKDNLDTATKLGEKFGAQCALVSNPGLNSLEITITDVSKTDYRSISTSRIASCVMLAYRDLVPDSMFNKFEGFDITIARTTADGGTTTVVGENRTYSRADVIKISSLYEICTTYLTEANAMKSFAGPLNYRDTTFLPDSVFVRLDSAYAHLFEKEVNEIRFLGYQENTTEGHGTVWVKIMRKSSNTIFACQFYEPDKKIINIVLNPHD